MKMKLLAMAMLTASALSAQARLGETPAQICARYGPVEPRADTDGTNNWTGHYVAGMWSIHVTFHDGKSVCEAFQSIVGPPIQDATRRELLREVSGSTNWVDTGPPPWQPGDDAWTNTVNGDVALYVEYPTWTDFPNDPEFTIRSAKDCPR